MCRCKCGEQLQVLDFAYRMQLKSMLVLFRYQEKYIDIYF